MARPMKLSATLAFAAAVALLAAAMPNRSDATTETRIATFGSGCFWCTESDFDKVPGVLKTVSGFMGGHVKNPSYRQVVRGNTGHTEVLQVTYDPSKVTYKQLLDYYWRHVDFYDGKGQFCDRGSQYRPAIFTHSDSQHKAAKVSKLDLKKTYGIKRPIAVEITPAGDFTAAETYHQDFYKKNPSHYHRYRIGCRRDLRIKQIWSELKAKS